MTDLIKQHASQIFNCSIDDIDVVGRLPGGMSNYTFIIQYQTKDYVLRIPGENAEQFVDRNLEQAMLDIIKPLHITSNTVYFDVLSGIKVNEYVKGTSMHQLKDYPYEKVAAILRQLHQSKLVPANDYNPLQRLEKYQALNETYRYQNPDQYYLLKRRFLGQYSFVDSFEKTICHGDSQPSNFVLTEDGNVLIVDFEFSGNNDPFYDVACFGNIDMASAVALLPYYLERTPSSMEYRRLYLWRAFQCLQWYNVAVYKHMIGLSEKLHMNFELISQRYLEKAKYMLDQADAYLK
jgi:thiamine kinase-like enzyme